ncbi:hypothetical protein GN956_G1637 [Arapaima gigas]
MLHAFVKINRRLCVFLRRSGWMSKQKFREPRPITLAERQGVVALPETLRLQEAGSIPTPNWSEIDTPAETPLRERDGATAPRCCQRPSVAKHPGVAAGGSAFCLKEKSAPFPAKKNT